MVVGRVNREAECRHPVAMLAKQRDGGYEQMKETSLCFLQIDVMVVNAAKSL